MSASTRTILAVIALTLVPAALVPASSVMAELHPERAFAEAWERVDSPVLHGEVSRTWLWGPAPRSDVMSERVPGDDGPMREVRYYDKGRMEIPNPDADPIADSYVRAGALTLELVTITTIDGDDIQELTPSTATVAGDPDDPNGLAYDQLAGLLDEPPFDEGSILSVRMAADGSLENDPSLAVYSVSAVAAALDADHSIASVFWDFLNSTGLVRDASGFTEEPLFPDPYFATGRPLTEAYWLSVRVGGVERDVLLQCFERRCLTFTPDNPEGWQVETNNIGKHYYEWRYRQPESDDPDAPDALHEAVWTTADGTTHTMLLEVAASDPTRQCGLMHRTELPGDSGMLFVWEADHQGSFWNCNTFVLLTLAWIDAAGTIVGFSDMEAQTPGEPQETVSYPPPGVYRYVIEANQGWFEERGISVGDRVDLQAALEHGDTSAVTLCQERGYECR